MGNCISNEVKKNKISPSEQPANPMTILNPMTPFLSIPPLNPETETIRNLIKRIEELAHSTNSWNVPAMKQCVYHLIPPRFYYFYSVLPKTSDDDWADYRAALISRFPASPLISSSRAPSQFLINAVEVRTEDKEKDGNEEEKIDEKEEENEGSETVFISEYNSEPLSSNKAYEILDSFIAGDYEATTNPILRPPAGAFVFYDLEKLANAPNYDGLERADLLKKIRLDGYRYNRTHSSKELTSNHGPIFRHYYSVYNRNAPSKVDYRFRRYEFSRGSHVMFHYIGDHLYARTVANTAHGNSSDPTRKFVRSNPSLNKKIDEQLTEGKTRAKVYRALINNSGDESEKPNSLKVVQNRADMLNRKKRIDQDLLAGVFRLSPILMYNDCESPFVSYMEIIRLRIHLFCEPAISELIRAYSITKAAQHLEFDTQFSISGHYLSNLIWRNPLLQGCPALTIGHYIHEFKNKLDHEEFIRDLLSQHPRLKNVRVLIGSDAEFDFTNVWPASAAVHCWLHWSKDIQSFCYRANIKFNCIARDLDELTYCESKEELLKKWDELKTERNYNVKLVNYMEQTSLRKFFQYSAIWHLRKAGLPDARNGYTTNTAESINALVARLENDMVSLDVCVASLFWLSVYQFNDTVRAWHGKGNWQLNIKFLHLKKDDSMMPKLMACPVPDEIVKFVGLSNTPIIAIARSLIASEKVKVVQGGTVLVEHKSQVFSVTMKVVRNKTSYLCACKVPSCLHSITAKIFMGVPVEDTCKVTLSGIKRSMKNPGDGKSGTKKGRTADKKVDKMIAKAEKKRAEKRVREDGQSQERKGRKKLKSMMDDDDEEEEEEELDTEESDEEEEEEEGVADEDENDEMKEMGFEEVEDEEEVFLKSANPFDDMMDGVNEIGKRKDANAEQQSVEELNALFDDDSGEDKNDESRTEINMTFTDLPRISSSMKCGPKGVSETKEGPKWLAKAIEDDPSFFNLESSLIYTPTFEFPLPRSEKFIIFRDKEGNFGAARGKMDSDQVTLITPASDSAALVYLSAFMSEDSDLSKVQVVPSQTIESKQLPLLLLLLHGYTNNVDLQTTFFPHVAYQEIDSFKKKYAARETNPKMKTGKGEVIAFTKYCQCRRPYPGKKLPEKVALKYDVPPTIVECSNCSFRWTKCIVGSTKKVNGVTFCDICTPFPIVPKWGDKDGKITNTCPLDGFLTTLLFAKLKNPEFHRILPTGEVFSKSCRSFITGADDVDQRKRAFVKEMYTPNKRGKYNLYGEEMDMVVEKAESACMTIVRSKCTGCSFSKDSPKMKYIVMKKDGPWKEAFESALFFLFRKPRCMMDNCGRMDLSIAVPENTWMIPFDVSQMFTCMPTEIDLFPRKITIDGEDFLLNAVSCFRGKPDGLSNHYSMVVLDGPEYISYDGLENPQLKRIRLEDIDQSWKPKTAYYFKC